MARRIIIENGGRLTDLGGMPVVWSGRGAEAHPRQDPAAVKRGQRKGAIWWGDTPNDYSVGDVFLDQTGHEHRFLGDHSFASAVE